MNPGLPARTWADFRFHARLSLGFQLLMQLVAAALLGPLMTAAIRKLALASGEAAVTNFDLVHFALSPAGLTLVLLSIAITGTALLAEFAGQTWIAGHAICRERLNLTAVAFLVVRRWAALAHLAARAVARLALLAIPWLLAAAVTWYTLLRAHDINFYLSKRPAEWQWALIVLLVLGMTYAVMVLRQLALWAFAIPILVYEEAAPAAALRDSAARLRGRLRLILVPLLTWIALVVVGGIVLAHLAQPIEAAAVRWGGMDFSRVVLVTVLLGLATLTCGFLQNALLVTGVQFLLTRMYVEQRNVPAWKPRPRAAPGPEHGLASRLVVASVVGALLAVSLTGAWLIVSRPVPEHAVSVTAHRGDSSRAPENTLAAFRAAMEAQATYAELDVQRSRDGQVVVLHDRDLMRMAGDARRITELTAADLSAIDIGSRYGPAYSGERVPSLESVIDLVRGHMKLNVELKYNVPDPQLAVAVVEVLRRKEFVDQVVITSLETAALQQIKAIEPRLITGQIVTAALGDVARVPADFLSLNATRATVAVVRRSHAAGKPVHVWTVNRQEAMLRMIDRGADDLITDNPALAVRIVRQLQGLSPPERLTLRMRFLFGPPPQELPEPDAVAPL